MLGYTGQGGNRCTQQIYKSQDGARCKQDRMSADVHMKGQSSKDGVGAEDQMLGGRGQR